MLDLVRSLPVLAGRRGAGTPCDTGSTIAPDRIRVGGDGVACLPNPGHETWMWCEVLDPGVAHTFPPTTFTNFATNWENSIKIWNGVGYDLIPLSPPGEGPANWDSVYTGPGPSPLVSSLQIIRALESAEARSVLGDSSLRSRLDIVDTLLQREVRAHGPGQDTRLLTARMQRLRQACTWVAGTSDTPDTGLLPTALASVEEALSAAPDDAAAHAWRAVLLDTRMPRREGGTWVAAPLDRAGALASLRRARELVPDHPGYALLQARWLAESDDFAVARQALQTYHRADRTLVRVLDDFGRLPRFRDLGFHALDGYALMDWRRCLGEALRRLGRDADFLEFRLRGWSWRGSADEAQGALQPAWPGFRWFRVEGIAGDHPGALYAQRVAVPLAGAAPVTRASDVSRDLEGGISLILLEHPAPAGGRPCCTLIAVDWRAPD